MNRLLQTFLCGACGIFVALSSAAEAAADTTSPVEVVVVTARKHAESVLKVPLSISVVGEKKIQEYDISNASDVARSVPNLFMSVSNGGEYPRISVRGVGNNTISSFYSQSVGLNLDGVFLPRIDSYFLDVLDLQRVEVLRGPQGTYFGKNTTAGLMNFVSKDPTNEFEAQGRVGYEFTTGQKLLEGILSGPLTDTLQARAVVQWRQSDGWIENLMDNRRVPRDTNQSARLTLIWEPISNLTVTSKTAFADFNRIGQTSELDQCGPANLAYISSVIVGIEGFPAPPCRLGRVQSSTITNGFSLDGTPLFVPDPQRKFSTVVGDGIKAYFQSITGSYGFEDGSSLTSVTGYTSFSSDVQTNPNASPFTPGPVETVKNEHNFSEEVRYLSPSDQSVSYIFGAYFEDETYGHQQIVNFDFPASIPAIFGLPPGVIPNLTQSATFKDFKTSSLSYAVFGEATWNITPQIRLIAGGRYTIDDLEGSWFQKMGGNDGHYDPNSFGAILGNAILGWEVGHFSGKRSEHDFSPSATAQWDFMENGQVYASFKEGYKSGGFDQGVSTYGNVVVGPRPVSCEGLPGGCIENPRFFFLPEEAQSYEIGSKFALVDEGVTFSIALFREIFKNLQTQAFVPGQPANIVTSNAAGASSQGVELEGDWAASPELNFRVNFAYTDAHYGVFDNSPCYQGQSPAQGCNIVPAGAIPVPVCPTGCEQDLSGAQLPLSPKAQFNIGADWNHPILGGSYITRLAIDFTYRDVVQNDATNYPQGWSKPSYLVDLSAGVSSADRIWDFQFIGRNLLNQVIMNMSAQPNFLPEDARVTSQADPATFELQLTLHN